jgi:hypothetical protein
MLLGWGSLAMKGKRPDIRQKFFRLLVPISVVGTLHGTPLRRVSLQHSKVLRDMV